MLGLILIDILLRSEERVGIIGSDLALKKGPKSFLEIAIEFHLNHLNSVIRE